jgi:MOSC domain-containing protein YiiM
MSSGNKSIKDDKGSLPRTLARVAGVFVGGPKTLRDANGEWVSSIARQPVLGPARLERRGFVGDQATRPYHGDLEKAVCLHSLSHYEYWNAYHGMHLAPGGVGENLTLDGADEADVCVGDVFQIGAARLQISAPRTPCDNQARYVGRADWAQLSLEHLRTGMYARVLAEGLLMAGDDFVLVERPNPELSVQALVRCYFHSFDPALAFRLMVAEGLMEWWQDRFERRLRENMDKQTA